MKLGIAMMVTGLMLIGVSHLYPDEKQEEDEIVLTLEKVTAPFDPKAVIEIEQKDGKFKKYGPKDHKEFDKEVEDGDLEITEYHIKDRRIIKLVFGKKQK